MDGADSATDVFLKRTLNLRRRVTRLNSAPEPRGDRRWWKRRAFFAKANPKSNLGPKAVVEDASPAKKSSSSRVAQRKSRGARQVGADGDPTLESTEIKVTSPRGPSFQTEEEEATETAKVDKNATDANATDANATDANATDANETDANAPSRIPRLRRTPPAGEPRGDDKKPSDAGAARQL